MGFLETVLQYICEANSRFVAFQLVHCWNLDTVGHCHTQPYVIIDRCVAGWSPVLLNSMIRVLSDCQAG